MIKEKIYGEIVQIIREMYDIQTSVIKDVKKILIQKGHTVDYSGTMSSYSSSYQLSHSTGEEYKILIPFLSKERENMLLAEALFEIETGMQDHAECKNLARRLMIPVVAGGSSSDSFAGTLSSAPFPVNKPATPLIA